MTRLRKITPVMNNLELKKSDLMRPWFHQFFKQLGRGYVPLVLIIKSFSASIFGINFANVTDKNRNLYCEGDPLFMKLPALQIKLFSTGAKAP